MNKTTLTALKQSIAHWRRMATGKAKRNEIPNRSGCALCGQFWIKGCIGCPVSLKTGLDSCINTPFREARSQYDNGTELQFRTAARKELSFLESLLPKPSKKRNK